MASAAAAPVPGAPPLGSMRRVLRPWPPPARAGMSGHPLPPPPRASCFRNINAVRAKAPPRRPPNWQRRRAEDYAAQMHPDPKPMAHPPRPGSTGRYPGAGLHNRLRSPCGHRGRQPRGRPERHPTHLSVPGPMVFRHLDDQWRLWRQARQRAGTPLPEPAVGSRDIAGRTGSSPPEPALPRVGPKARGGAQAPGRPARSAVRPPAVRPAPAAPPKPGPKAVGAPPAPGARLSFTWRFAGTRVHLQAAPPRSSAPMAYRWAVSLTR